MARVPARQEIYNTHSGLTRGGGGVSLGSGGGVVQANAQAGLSGVMDAALRAGGKLLETGAREYVDEQRGRVEDAVLRAGVRFERWKQAYNEAHQGGQALGARDAYVAAWQEIAGEEIRNFQGRPNERFGHDLEREMVKKGLFALRDGGNYEAAQREAWRGSQLEGQLASFEILCANDPMDQAAIDIGYRDALQSWRQKNPGLDDTAFRAKLDNIAFQTRLDNLLAGNRLDDAEKLLASYERGMAGVAEQGQAGQAVGAAAGQVAGAGGQEGQGGRRFGPGGKLRELVAGGGHPALDAAGNPLGVADIRGMEPGAERLIREAARRYNVPEELALALAMQESGGRQSVISPAGAIGVMQLMPGTARELGVNPHDMAQNIDGGVRYLAAMRDRYKGDPGAALTAYNMGPGGYDKFRAGKRGITRESREYAGRVLGRLSSVSPKAQAAMADKIRLARERVNRQAEEGAQLRAMAEMEALINNSGEPETALYDYLAAIPDPGTRLRLERVGRAQLDYKKRDREARDASQGRALYLEAIGENRSPIEALARIQQAPTSQGARDIARDLVLGKSSKPDLQNTQALNHALIEIDSGNLASPEERNVYAINHRLTPSQWQKLMDYQGKMANVSFSRVEAAARIAGLKLQDDQLWALFQMVEAELPPGKPATTADIQKVCALLALKGNMPRSGALSALFPTQAATYQEALKDGQHLTWLPNIDKAEIPLIDQALKKAGHKINEHNRRKMKKTLYNRADINQWLDE